MIKYPHFFPSSQKATQLEKSEKKKNIHATSFTQKRKEAKQNVFATTAHTTPPQPKRISQLETSKQVERPTNQKR